MKIVGFILFIIILSAFIVGFFLVMNQDCEKNPPQTLVCNSNNLLDNSLEDCILLEHKDFGFLGFGSHDRIYSCERSGGRVEIEYQETKCKYSMSNLTADYKFCRGMK